MRFTKRFTAILISVVLAVISVISCFGAARYYENGYYYSFLNNSAVELVGWDYSSTVLPVPDKLNGRPVTAIANNAFMDDNTLTGIDFTNAGNLGSIGLYSFSNCTNISGKLVLPGNVFFIDICAFEGCTSLQEVEINSDLQSIYDQCFNNCSSLTTVKLNDGLEQISNYSFANCTALKKIVIPESVTYIAPSAFNNDPNLKIYGFADSYAQTYAQEHNIPFVEMVRFMLGDVDGIDGVNISDVTAIQSHLAELKTVEGIYLLAADANQDDIVDISDATAIQMKLAEYELPYPIGQYVTQEIVSE